MGIVGAGRHIAIAAALGLDLTVGGTMAAGRLRPYGGAGCNRLQPRFQVSFTNRLGGLDDRRVEVDLNADFDLVIDLSSAQAATALVPSLGLVTCPIVRIQ